jgi:hypothetical protein
MSENTEKYEKVVRMLRDSEPFLLHPESIEEKVIKRIESNSRIKDTSPVFDRLFSWIYIGWIRRSFILLSVSLLIIFVYQQAGIIRAVRILENEVVSIKGGKDLNKSSVFERRLTLFKVTSGLVPERKIEVYESQLEEFMDSYNDILVKYKNLTRIIEDDTLLKKYVETRLSDESRDKSKL